ncbi:formate dehydrogenase accessory sulfurtransferase FdhD [Pseudorhodobacter sp. MZDSW-24AT]|uniref:formate dehydrogenase accessory sulfurtransferase FdhD n=1 Tax=Pseudorhodobacter sp. MZDSW-24AT TaxID=2052957 RepID=UPI000C1DF327|nr:formate dehydrogenase accessory sulfurtransferase FdhD [Pseudorhodobacter sp. MZDSW-24AT]PJF09244.1 sulfurtransferase FdhD [Pseudorhodobacter sp. MZDSW-24AT]
MRAALTGLRGVSVQGDSTRDVLRSLPEETPVALVFNGTTAAVMMASPLDLEDFAYGFALTEGFIDHPAQVRSLDIIAHPSGTEARFWIDEAQARAIDARRRSMLGPVGCGLCGIDSLDQAIRPLPVLPPGGPVFARAEVAAATDLLRAHQPLHDQTHAVHAAGFLLPGQGIVLAREDVGRHNALDKLIGAMARAGRDAGAGAFVLTSRVSVDMVQKTVLAGCPTLIAVSAPTAHAQRLAAEANLTLVAFARGGGFDVYAHPHRIQTGAPHAA